MRDLLSQTVFAIVTVAVNVRELVSVTDGTAAMAGSAVIGMYVCKISNSCPHRSQILADFQKICNKILLQIPTHLQSGL